MTDFTKAFDKIPHQTILDTLHFLGIFGSLLRWIESYLSNRELLVRASGFISASFIASSGVPQGSHLGPLLFTLVMNGVSSVLQNGLFLIYADDLKLFRVIHSQVDCELLQAELNTLSAWCSSKGLSLSTLLSVLYRLFIVKHLRFTTTIPLMINLSLDVQQFVTWACS